MDKTTLRQQIRAAKRAHSPEELRSQSEQILQQLVENHRFHDARRVMLYASLPDEVQTLDFLDVWRHRKTVILPTVAGDDIIPVELADNVTFAEGDFHIPEPQSHPYTGDFDLIVVPGMAFDKAGHRLGRGKGYYDRFLAKHPQVYTIGLCFDFQLLPEVPSEPHDCLINEVISI